MSNICKSWFYGFVFIFVDFHIFIDILPDPIGYYFIYKGMTRAKSSPFPSTHKVRLFSYILMFLTIPYMINIEQFTGSSTAYADIHFFTIYNIIVGWMDIVLIFYIFQFLIQALDKYQNYSLEDKEVRSILLRGCTFYVSFRMLIMILHPFSMNVYEQWDMILYILIFISIVATLYFLLILYRMKHHFSEALTTA
ncbi:hypothetical protein [Longirhabdus pacifica]|uniref:hypothetical protein n=1 Tax=Longirhabdus pacifica TaxID=2305227 RepID=UPI001009198C|nr:hypothetical protein [Longirhabdus pacifica]